MCILYSVLAKQCVQCKEEQRIIESVYKGNHLSGCSALQNNQSVSLCFIVSVLGLEENKFPPSPNIKTIDTLLP